MQGVGVKAVILHPFLEVADEPVHVAFHGEVLVGDLEFIGAHEPQLVEVGDMDGDIGFARPGQFAQHGRTPAGFGQEGIGEAAEFAPLLFARGIAPEPLFVFADGIGAIVPGGRHDQGFAHARGEQGVAPGEQPDLARGVPPGKDDGVFWRMLVDGSGKRGQFAQPAVGRADQLAGAVLPVEHDRRGLAAPGSVGDGKRLVQVLCVEFVPRNGQVGPGCQAQLAEFVHAAFFHQLVAVGRGARVEPEPGKPDEQKNSSRHQENTQQGEESVMGPRRGAGAAGG